MLNSIKYSKNPRALLVIHIALVVVWSALAAAYAHLIQLDKLNFWLSHLFQLTSVWLFFVFHFGSKQTIGIYWA